ncbi:MAG: TetR family transcriptional regulator [Hyphococcus sp.]|nr:MAG: TetR family transcriptional regulator [Marinicaulis sp.]
MAPSAKADMKEAVAAAKEVFWVHGFDDASIEELVQATGLNRYALYNTFGGKLELFLAVLEDYYTERKSLFMTTLGDPAHGPMDAIRHVSEFCITEMAERGAGCLMCNVAQEVGQHEEIVSERVKTYLDEIQSAKEMALTQAEERGELNPAITPGEGAALLMSNMLGVGVMARNGASRRQLLNVFNTCMAALSVTKPHEKT